MARAAQAAKAGAEDDDAPSTKERSSGVQSLERAFGLLEEIARHPEGIGLADLSKQVGLHNSTTFHLVKTLTSLGYARQSPETKRYHVGRMVYGLAASSMDEIELVNIATPILEALAEETGESTHLAVRAGADVIIAARCSGPGAFQLSDRTRGARPAHATALGKVLLAALTPAQADKLLSSRELTAMTPKTITDIDRFRVELERVRATQVAFDDCEFNLEVRCIAVPVHDYSGKTIAAIGLSGPVWRLSFQALHDLTPKVVQAAGQLSAELGARDLAPRLVSAASTLL